MSLLRERLGRRSESRSITTLGDLASAINTFGYAGNSYPYGTPWSQRIETTMGVDRAEPINEQFVDMVRGAYRTNGVVFACMLARQLAFSATRFAYQRVLPSKPSELFGHASLTLLERPWTGGTTQDLLSRTIQDADISGNAYWTVRGRELVRLRPDWVSVLAARRLVPSVETDDLGRRKPGTLGWERIGYVYEEGGPQSDEPAVFLPADEVAHFAPIPDPLTAFVGMSWLTPVLRDVMADQLMTRHRTRLFELGGTPNMIVKHPETASPDKIRRFAEEMRSQVFDADDVYKALHLYPGADATVVGSSMQELDYKATLSVGEDRIAMASRVPAVIVGLPDGMQGSSLNTGNFTAARQLFADGLLHPLWQNMAGSFEPLVVDDVRALARRGDGAVRLWYDPRDVPLLRQDAKSAAEIAEIQARTIAQYVMAGYTPDSAKRTVMSGDPNLLQHTGLYSVQLLPPGAGQAPTTGDDDG